MKKSEKEAAAELTRLIGLKSYTKTSSPCRGKWRGTTDHGLRFDNGAYYFVSNGMGNFEQHLREKIGQVKYFQANRDKYLELLTDNLKDDNAVAGREGLHAVKLIDVKLCTEKNNYFLWPYLILEVNGKQFRHITTSLNYALLENTVEKYIEEKKNSKIYTAGAVQIPDYIFGNVRFCSTDNLYKIII